MAQSKVCFEEKTSFKSSCFVYRWSIEDFSKWPDTFALTSREFKPMNDHTFYLTLCKSKNTDVFLAHNFRGKNRISMKHIISVIDCKETEFEKGAFTHVYTENSNIFNLKYSADNLIKYTNSTDDKTLIFNCVMEFGKLSTASVFENQQVQIPTDNVPDLLKDLKAMYDNSMFSDLNLLAEDGVIPVHKFILCARSPVFSRMFKSPMEEEEKDTIRIHDIELPTLRSFVEFLYTGNITDAEFEPVCALYYAADKYDVPSLRKACAQILLAKMDVENACRILSLADRHADLSMKDLVMKFMQNEFDAILVSESWIELVKKETKLAVEVMESRIKKSEMRSSSSDCLK